MSDALASTKPSLTLDDAQWGVPYSYYHWGVYYREDMYAELGLTPAATWEEQKANCQAILDSGRKCYAIGTRFQWTAAGWFDYMRLHTHGFDFHMEFTNGEISWTDGRVGDIFANWRELIGMGAYIANHTSYSWQEALPFMVNGEAWPT